MPELLVVSSVHPPDDPRIRHKLIPTLATEWSVSYATSLPGPIDPCGCDWLPLRGPRVLRSLRASFLLLRGRYDVASVHDPELLPAALLASALRRRVVYDVHEDLPGQLAHRRGWPSPARRLLAMLASGFLRMAERFIPLTLAEQTYSASFRREHPVIPNLLEPFDWPERPSDDTSAVVYLGDVTEARGAKILLQAVAEAAAPPLLHFIGRCAEPLRDELTRLARSRGMDVEFHGFLDRTAAMEIVATCRLGVAPLRDTPNYRDSMPTKILEYLAVGIPVVASDLPGTRRVAGSLPGVVLVPPDDVAALSSAISAVVSEPGHAEAAAANTGAIRAGYRWPGDEVRQFYASVLA